MGLTFKTGETVEISSQVEALDAALQSLTINIKDKSDGTEIIPDTLMDNEGNQTFKYYWETKSDEPEDWSPEVPITSGDLLVDPIVLPTTIKPTTPNGFKYVATNDGITGKAEPEWVETLNSITHDHVPIWETDTEYQINDKVVAITPDYITQYNCINAGKTGNLEPTWDTIFGNQTNDGPSTWTPSTEFEIDDVRTAITPDGITQYRVTVAGTSGIVEPVWNPTFGNDTNDGPPIWQATTAYISSPISDIIVPTVSNGFQYRCIVDGTTSGSEPTIWPTIVGSQFSNGTAQFITEVLDDVTWVAEAYNPIIWEAEAYTGVAWNSETLVSIVGIYNVKLLAVDVHGHSGIEKFDIRIVED